MKRVIKYHSQYTSDGANFSDCSTKYEIMPFIVPDEAGISELKAIAKQLGFKSRGEASVKANQYRRDHVITHALKLQGKATVNTYLGFITLEKGLTPVAKPGKKLTSEQIREIRDNQSHGFYDVIEIDGESMIVMQDHSYYHAIKLCGYDMEHFEKKMGTNERTFSDSVSSCDECGEWDYNDNGANYNFKSIDESGYYGVNCGCYAEQCEAQLDKFVNKANRNLDEDVAETLEKAGKIEEVEETPDYGRTVDRATRLKTALETYPGSKFIFVESYRSVSLYRLAGKPKVIRVS